MPTSSKVRRDLFSALPPLERGTIVDLGSGWGHLIFPLAKTYPTCRVIGYENSPIPYLFSFLMNCAPNLKTVYKNFFNVSLQDANLVVCYLCPKVMKHLKPKFETELKPGTQVISHTFAIPGWIPSRVIRVDDLYLSKIYLYEV